LRAAVFFAGLRDVDFLRPVVFLAAAMPPPLSWFFRRTDPSAVSQDAMRFRRRRSRSLMPPQTPYRSSRRSA
jgi:hypothetical protein